MTLEDTSLPPESSIGHEKLIAIGQMAGNVAHQINNHLTTILTFAHLMREKANLDAQDRDDLDLMIGETTKATALARGLQDFSRNPLLDRAHG